MVNFFVTWQYNNNFPRLATRTKMIFLSSCIDAKADEGLYEYTSEWVSGRERERGNKCMRCARVASARDAECSFKAQLKWARLFRSSWHAGSHGDDDDDEVLGSSCQALVIFAHFTTGAIRDTSRANSVLLSLSLHLKSTWNLTPQRFAPIYHPHDNFTLLECSLRTGSSCVNQYLIRSQRNMLMM